MSRRRAAPRRAKDTLAEDPALRSAQISAQIKETISRKGQRASRLSARSDGLVFEELRNQHPKKRARHQQAGKQGRALVAPANTPLRDAARGSQAGDHDPGQQRRHPPKQYWIAVYGKHVRQRRHSPRRGRTELSSACSWPDRRLTELETEPPAVLRPLRQ